MSDLGRARDTGEESPIRLSRTNVACLLLLFALLFALVQFGPLRKNGFWLDELFALWASEPSISLREVLSQRILPDPNPPGYFLLLYWFRQCFGDIVAPIMIGIIFLGASILFVVAMAKRAGVPALGVLCAFFFLGSGPVLYYFGETRAYLCALTVAFVVSWLAAQAAVIKDHTPSPVLFACVGILAALIHVYAALYCCSLAAAMLCLAWLEPDKKYLQKGGFALGSAAALTSALTMLPMQDSIAKIDWIKFDVQHVVAAVTKAGALSVAPIWVALALILLMTAKKKAGIRSLVWLFAIAYAVFALVPILVSFKIPIISARYWIVGSPGLIILVGFAFWEWLPRDPSEYRVAPRGKYLAFVVVSAPILLVSFAVADFAKNAKLIWKGGEALKPLAAHCENHSIRVANSFKPTDRGMSADGAFVPAFAYSSGRSESVFIPVRSIDQEKLLALDTSCPVIGWAENFEPDALKSSSDQDLLRLLNVEVPLGDVEIYRERSGFFILKKRRGSEL